MFEIVLRTRRGMSTYDAPVHVIGEDGVEDGVRDLVGNLVWMPLGDGLRGEGELARSHRRKGTNRSPTQTRN
jgi:hypothetical protein